MSLAERVGTDPVRAWAGAALALLVAVGVGSVAFPRTVYDGFVWQYFWGPVQADAHSAACAVRAGGTTSYLDALAACRAASGVVAYPGYTLVSEVGYVVLLLFGVSGVILLLRQLDVGGERDLVVALLPFVFFGGALRVVEDATDTGASTLLAYPLNTLVISPVIYVTVFVVTLVALLASVAAARRGVVERYERPLFGLGLVALLATLAVLAAVATGETAAFHPQVLVVVLVLATGVTGVVRLLIRRFAPWIDEGTGPQVGFVVVWAHAVDGAANVVGLDWMPALGAGPNLVPKHPVNRAIVEVTGAVLPESVLAVTGDAWPFLLVKLLAATFVVAVFDRQMFEENPRYAVLLLVAVVAVGLGPGTRDLLRATLGV
ncbi:MAG: DUF63 family protein [Haloferacaceae archaeon]